MFRDSIDIMFRIWIASVIVLIIVFLMLFCAGCAYKEPFYNKFWDNMTSTRIETQGLVTPSGEQWNKYEYRRSE